MRFASAAVVLCVVAAPTFADAVTYTFDVTSGSMLLDMSPDGVMSPDPASSGIGGTFAVTIYQSNGHIGESDTFMLQDAGLYNTDLISVSIMSIATAHVYPGSAQFLDFAPDGPDHIGPGGVAAVETDVFVDIAVTVEGTIGSSGFWTSGWAGRLLPFDMSFTTSQSESDVLVVTVGGTFSYEIGVTAVSQTLTLDLIVNAVGTAHVVPDPALGGLSALGLIGGGAWLRRRRP